MLTRTLCAAVLAATCFSTQVLAQDTVSRFTENVLVHVIAHEMGHALIREFDLPILTYEEGMAEDFATLWVLQSFGDRAPDVIRDRALSHLADLDEPGVFSEYLHDAQRAGRILCVAYGVDQDRFTGLAEEFGMDLGEEGADCIDMAQELARSWRRVWTPLLLPEGAPVTEVRITGDRTDPLVGALGDGALPAEIFDMLASIDWHSQITLNFAQCDGGANWRRNGREIRICSSYVARIEEMASAMPR